MGARLAAAAAPCARAAHARGAARAARSSTTTHNTWQAHTARVSTPPPAHLLVAHAHGLAQHLRRLRHIDRHERAAQVCEHARARAAPGRAHALCHSQRLAQEGDGGRGLPLRAVDDAEA